MLIFVKGPYLTRIANGEKTATIRPWRSCTLKPGDVLTFNGRLRCRVRRVTLCTLDTLTDAHIAADGFASRAAFLRAYRQHYPTAGRDCCVLQFGPPSAIQRRERSGASRGRRPK